MPAIAGILMIIAAFFNILWLFTAFARIVDLKETLHFTWVISPLPYFVLAVGFGGNTALANILAVIFVLGILLSIIGGIFAMRKRLWSLAFAGALGALVAVPLFGLTSIILIAMSKRRFIGPEK